jgi:surface protein
MSEMFEGCSSLKNVNLSEFKTENTINMNNMFSRCSSLKELNLSDFNTKNVTDMVFMFSGCSNDLKIFLNFNKINLKFFSVLNFSFRFIKINWKK